MPHHLAGREMAVDDEAAGKATIFDDAFGGRAFLVLDLINRFLLVGATDGAEELELGLGEVEGGGAVDFVVGTVIQHDAAERAGADGGGEGRGREHVVARMVDAVGHAVGDERGGDGDAVDDEVRCLAEKGLEGELLDFVAVRDRGLTGDVLGDVVEGLDDGRFDDDVVERGLGVAGEALPSVATPAVSSV